jgi:uncharacterized protein (DUF885 family)
MTSSHTPTSPIFTVASDHVDAIAALDPFEATAMGIPGHDADVSDFSPAGLAARADLARQTLARLAALQPTNNDDAIARAVMQDALADEIAEFEAGDAFYGVRPIAGPVPALCEIFDLMPRATEDDWRNIVARLSKLPHAAEGIQALFSEGLQQGKIAARRQVEEVLKQLAAYSGEQPGTPAAFASLPDELAGAGLGETALADELERAVERGRDAFRGLRSFFNLQYLARATESEAAGRERYSRAARRFLGMALDLEETYNWGWEEIARLDAEMAATANRIKPGASVQQAAELLDADQARLIEGEQNLIVWLQQLEDDAIRAVDGRLVDLPEPAKRIEAKIAPPGGSLAQYYTQPSEDFSRPGQTWYPTGGHTTFHRWRDVTTAYHEGVPGHHLQSALALYQAARLSRFQRMAVWYPGHGEGWALYAERLMAEEGFLADPGDYLGMLLGQMHRAVRVVVDLGLHTGQPIPQGSGFEPGEPWSYARMKAFLMRKAETPEDFAHSETVRYLGWPGQAIAYKVGERAWLRLRDEARARQGAAFTLRQFHNTALALGSMGLDLLGRTLAEALPA